MNVVRHPFKPNKIGNHYSQTWVPFQLLEGAPNLVVINSHADTRNLERVLYGGGEKVVGQSIDWCLYLMENMVLGLWVRYIYMCLKDSKQKKKNIYFLLFLLLPATKEYKARE